jgi:hypothetical protein
MPGFLIQRVTPMGQIRWSAATRIRKSPSARLIYPASIARIAS